MHTVNCEGESCHGKLPVGVIAIHLHSWGEGAKAKAGAGARAPKSEGGPVSFYRLSRPSPVELCARVCSRRHCPHPSFLELSQVFLPRWEFAVASVFVVCFLIFCSPPVSSAGSCADRRSKREGEVNMYR